MARQAAASGDDVPAASGDDVLASLEPEGASGDDVPTQDEDMEDADDDDEAALDSEFDQTVYIIYMLILRVM